MADLRSIEEVKPSAPTLVQALEDAAAADAPFLTFHGSSAPVRFDARAARESARRWASALADVGVSRGEPVAILFSTSPDFVGALLGVMHLGAIPLPLPAPMTFGTMDRYLEHLGRVVLHAGAQVLCTSPRVCSALEGLSLRASLRAVVVPEDVARTAVRAVGPTSLDERAPALLQYTSGTTGRPKGVVISHRALMANTAAIAAALRLTSADVGVSWLPLYHDMGLVGALLTAIAHPYALHVLPPEAFVMKPRRWLELIAEHRATVSTAPNFAYELTARRASAEGLDLSSWRAALDGAEPVHAATLQRFVDKLAPAGLRAQALRPVYGLAEATLAVSFHPEDTPLDATSVDRRELETARRVVSRQGDGARVVVGVGVPVAGTSISVTNERGQVLAEDVVGEIRVRGPGLMDGYHRDEAASIETLVDGQLRTGDLGFVRKGRLHISGRARELIIQAGRNVHPEDVEQVALELDARLGAAAAFARPNGETGTDDLVLVVESRGVRPEERDELAKRLRGEILGSIGIKADAVAFWPTGAIPRTSSGKVKRRECASRFLSEAAVAAGETS